MFDQDRMLSVGETDEEANLRLNSLEYEVSDKLGGTSQNDYRLDLICKLGPFIDTLYPYILAW